jgi:phage terminase large subunit-like protein
MGRQNGKSVLGAIFGMYGLLREAGAMVVGVASSAEQARIIYDRTMLVIASNPQLKKRFQKLTETRGIKSKNGSVYEIKASKSAALQGIPISLGMADELHITKAEVWRAMVNGTRSKDNGIIIGVTTAGDDTSELLKDLYQRANKAAAGEDGLERFGAFIWQAPEAHVPETDEELAEYLLAANPALAAGRLDMETTIFDVRTQPETDAVRYSLNRFIGSSNAFLSAGLWHACALDPEDFPALTRPVFAIDHTPGAGWATVTASQVIDGVTYTEVVASVQQPNVERLSAIVADLWQHNPALFVVEGYTGRPLGNELKARGYPVAIASTADGTNAAAMLYAKTAQKRLKHRSDPLLSVQLPRAVRKNSGEAYRISRADSGVEIDAVISTSLGVYFAENVTEAPLQLFV